MEWLTKKPIAHRGIHDNNTDSPENSMKSFEKAIEWNLPIEMDVHLLTDNKIVVFHDDTLDRVTDKKGKTTSFSSKEICNTQLFNSGQNIPLFTDLPRLSKRTGTFSNRIEKQRHQSIHFRGSVIASFEEL